MASKMYDLADGRSEARDEVHYRARAYDAAGRPSTLLVVNISSGGLMARCEEAFDVGSSIRVTLPVLGQVAAQIRWSLGGRIGCQFDRTVGGREYRTLLAALPTG